MNRFLGILALAAFGLLYAGPAEAAMVQVPSCEETDVRAALEAANDGDIILLPAGNCSWTNTVLVGKSVSLIGAGMEQTVITDNVNEDHLIQLGDGWIPANPRISGMTLVGAAPKSGFKAMISVSSLSNALGFRIDHVRFTNPTNIGIATWDWVWGVMDHCIFDTHDTNWAIMFNNDAWGGPSYGYGDKSWNDPDDFGTDKFVFVEDSTFNNTGSAPVNYSDSYGGARYVLRYNTYNNGFLRAHGTDSTPGRRGTRAMEVYNNSFVNNGTPIYEALEFRSGAAVFYNNTVSGSGGMDTGITLKAFRNNGHHWPGWGNCDGTSWYDQNIGGDEGACLDQPGRGKSDLMTSGDDPQPHAWPNQAQSPVHIWGNSGFKTSQGGSSSPRIAENRDFHLDVPMPGYTPYTYPHPLAAEAN